MKSKPFEDMSVFDAQDLGVAVRHEVNEILGNIRTLTGRSFWGEEERTALSAAQARAKLPNNQLLLDEPWKNLRKLRRITAAMVIEKGTPLERPPLERPIPSKPARQRRSVG